MESPCKRSGGAIPRNRVPNAWTVLGQGAPAAARWPTFTDMTRENSSGVPDQLTPFRAYVSKRAASGESSSIRERAGDRADILVHEKPAIDGGGHHVLRVLGEVDIRGAKG
jgi:hypothetical protein